MKTILAIALGGALGTILRYLLNNAVVSFAKGTFPFGIMTINILGSMTMGVLIALFADVWEPPQLVRSFLMVGVLGGFTTFSTFSADTVLLWQRGESVQAMLYVGVSVAASVLALVGGMLVVRGLSG